MIASRMKILDDTDSDSDSSSSPTKQQKQQQQSSTPSSSLTPPQPQTQQKTQRDLVKERRETAWLKRYMNERLELGPNGTMQRLLHLRSQVQSDPNNSSTSISGGKNGYENEAKLRSRRAMTGTKCGVCGKVGVFEVNCFHCHPSRHHRNHLNLRESGYDYDYDSDYSYDYGSEYDDAGFDYVRSLNGDGNGKSWFWSNVNPNTDDAVNAVNADTDNDIVSENENDVNSLSNSIYTSVGRDVSMWDVNSLHSLNNHSSAFNPTSTSTSSSYQSMSNTNSNSTNTNTDTNTTRRSTAETNLHLVLHRLITLVSTELTAIVNSDDFSRSLFRLPRQRYSGSVKGVKTSVVKLDDDDKFYRVDKQDKTSSDVKSYNHKNSYKPVDAVSYVFDRTFQSNQSESLKHHSESYAKFEGRHKSNHSIQNWISLTSKNNEHAVTGRAAEVESRNVERGFDTQKVWVDAQSNAKAKQRGKCELLYGVLCKELHDDEVREINGCAINSSGSGIGGNSNRRARTYTVQMMKERSESADRVMRVLGSTGFIPSVEIADYLKYTFQLGRARSRSSSKSKVTYKRDRNRDGSIASDTDSFVTQEEGTETIADESTIKSSKTSTTNSKSTTNNGMAEYGNIRPPTNINNANHSRPLKSKFKTNPKNALAKSLHMLPSDPFIATYMPHLEKLKTSTKSSSKSSSTSTGTTSKARADAINFKNAGLKGNIRLGRLEDSGDLPALIHLPACYSTSSSSSAVAKKSSYNNNKNNGNGSNSGSSRNGSSNDEEKTEKSHTASIIMTTLRAKSNAENNGLGNKVDVGLYHRVSMDDGVTYSGLVGRPFHFFEPRT